MMLDSHAVAPTPSGPQRRFKTIDLLSIMRAEFGEMPGLQLTVQQAQRLWNLERADCTGLLDALVEGGVLRRSGDGVYAKR